MAADPRRLAGAALADALRDARATTLAGTLDRADDAWHVPAQPGINPVAWELGQSPGRRVLDPRLPQRAVSQPRGWRACPIAARRDLDWRASRTLTVGASRCRRARIWSIAPTRSLLVHRCHRRGGEDDAANYFHRLALFHEDMHGEAFVRLRATLAWPAPPRGPLAAAGAERSDRRGALALAGGADARACVRQRATGKRRPPRRRDRRDAAPTATTCASSPRAARRRRLWPGEAARGARTRRAPIPSAGAAALTAPGRCAGSTAGSRSIRRRR
jgi:hypothetical protein